MGEKGKGKDAGKAKAKKSKATKVGKRPHEQRARETVKQMPEGLYLAK
jgi:hypothetical protein